MSTQWANVCHKIARNLQTFGYPDVSGQYVYEQLQLPQNERDVIGQFAAGMLRDNGVELEGENA